MGDKYVVNSKGSVVVCLNDKDISGVYMIDLPITKGKHYTLRTDIKSYHTHLCITDDKGSEFYTTVDRFIALSDMREERIDKILL